MTTKITVPLDIDSLEILSQSIDYKGNIILEVRSKKTETMCHKCGKSATIRHGHGQILRIKHLPILKTPLYLQIKPLRYRCEHCNDHPTTTEQYDWCKRGSNVSRSLENFLLLSLVHSTIQDVSRKYNVGYKELTSIVNRNIDIQVDWDQYKDLNTIGIDEISMKKGHKSFVTIISSRTKHDELSVIAVLEHRKKDAVKAFFESIPNNLRKTVKTVCTDMYDGFVNAAIEVFGSQAVVVDRYHVARLYRAPLDKLRIREMIRLKAELPPEEYAKLEGMMWVLRSQHECLTDANKTKLQLLYKHSPKLKAAHGHALKLTNIFNTHCSRKVALTKFNRWIMKVKSSNTSCFSGFVVTLQKYKSSILNYFKNRKNSGFVEGLNNKIKVAKRRCYGFFKTESLFQRLFLDLKGFKVYA